MKEGGELSLLHAIFQLHHIPPHTVLSWDPYSRKVAYASMLLRFEEEDKANKKANKGRTNLLEGASLKDLSNRMGSGN
jgi:hypothetical protein